MIEEEEEEETDSMSEDDDNVDEMDTHDQMMLTNTVKTLGTSNRKTQVQMIDFFVFTVYRHFYFVVQV